MVFFQGILNIIIGICLVKEKEMGEEIIYGLFNWVKLCGLIKYDSQYNEKRDLCLWRIIGDKNVGSIYVLQRRLKVIVLFFYL